jgi:hypothetical protein
MKTKKSFFTVLLAMTVVLVGFTSCQKCNVAEEDTNSGIIVQDVIIYPKIGYLTDVCGVHVTGANQYADQLEVSWDGGLTRQPIDYNTYDVLCNPMIVQCEASFEREVKINAAANIVQYDITATTCSSCEAQYHVENFVLVPKIAGGLSVYTDQTIITQ